MRVAMIWQEIFGVHFGVHYGVQSARLLTMYFVNKRHLVTKITHQLVQEMHILSSVGSSCKEILDN